ncbi:MAG: ABC transporter ATP-binding protein/permease [Oscillospiraceae bacterium]|jgi:ATP-binding cassette subfamily B protein|nr:ABC transporter ATP-binding protein/permease [Oscillospiraceae bacterium]
MKRLIGQLRPYKMLLALCAACVLLANLTEIAKPAVIARAITVFLEGGAQESGLHSLLGMGFLYLCVAIIGALCAYAQALLVTTVCQKVLHGIRGQLFHHIQHMPLEALDRFGTGRLITRATNDVETVSEFYSDVLVNLFRDVVLLIGIVAAMLLMDWRLALVSFAVLPLIALLTLAVRRRLRRNFVEMKRLIGTINAFFAENLSGMRIVQAFNRQKDKYREFAALNNDYFKTTVVQVTMHSFLRPAMEVVNSLAIALLVWVGCRLMIGDQAGLTAPLEIGVLYAFTDYIKRFFEPINDLAEKYTTVQNAQVSAERIDSLLSDPAQEALTDGRHKGRVRGKIEFRGVWFAYEGEEWVLRDVSFTVKPGEKIAFVGATGAGKSTIIQLISRLYTPQRGQILVDGVPLSDWRLADLRRGISVVLQDVFLFAGSIADNIRIAEPMGDDKVAEALKIALADDFVERLPGGMQSELGERGGTLSQGERQLLSFARAIAHDPAILVLDEATASIDTLTEQRIQQSILRISQNRTAIFIAHRLSTIERCDAIYVVENGKIIERGDHRQLLRLNGAYAALLREKAG